MASSERKAAHYFPLSIAAFAASLAIASYTAATSRLPNMMGSSGEGFWTDRELRFTAVSSVLAIGVGVSAPRAARGAAPQKSASRVGRLALGAGLAVLACAGWFMAGLFYAPLVAPAQAFAGIRLFDAWQRWRADQAWKRLQ